MENESTAISVNETSLLPKNPLLIGHFDVIAENNTAPYSTDTQMLVLSHV